MKAFKIELGENAEKVEEYLVQPLRVDMLPEALPIMDKLAELGKGREDEDDAAITQEEIDTAMELFTLIMSRNYPDKTKEEWGKIVDLGDIVKIIGEIGKMHSGFESPGME